MSVIEVNELSPSTGTEILIRGQVNFETPPTGLGGGGGSGANGQDAFTTLSAGFTQPAVGANVTATVVNSSFLVAGLPVYVEGGGFYTVFSVPNETEVVLANLGYTANAAPGASVASGGKIVTCGLKGEAGAGGVIATQNTLCLSGDSRLAIGASNDVDGDPNGFNSCSQILWMNDHFAALGGVGFDLITNASQGGETLASAVSQGRWAKALSSPARICIMMYMHNDVNPFGSVDDTIGSFLTKYEAALIEMMATKDCVIVFSGTPLVSAASGEMNKTWYRFPAINAGLKRLCAKYPKAIYVDQYECVLDKTSNALEPIAGTIQDDDGVHLTTKGAQIMGHAAAAQLADKLLLTKYKTKGPNLLPAWTGTGGTKSGTFVCTTNNVLPAGWEIRLDSGGSSASEVVISAIDGNIRRLVFTNTAGTDVRFQVRLGTTARFALAELLDQDDLIQASFGFQLFDNAGANLGGFARLNGSNSFVTLMGGKSSNEQTLVVPSLGVGGVRLSAPLRLKTVPTEGEFVIQVDVPATTGVCTLDVWNPELYKLT